MGCLFSFLPTPQAFLFCTCIFTIRVGNFILSWTLWACEAFYSYVRTVLCSGVSASPAISTTGLTALSKVYASLRRYLDWFYEERGPLPIRAIKYIGSWAVEAGKLFGQAFCKSLWIGFVWLFIIVVFFVISAFLLPVSVEPSVAVLQFNSISSGFINIYNSIAAGFNTIAYGLDVISPPLDIIFGFVIRVGHLVYDYFVGRLSVNRLFNLKGFSRLAVFFGFNPVSNGQLLERGGEIAADFIDERVNGPRRALAQALYGSNAEFGINNLALGTDSGQTQQFASVYASILIGLSFALDLIYLAIEIWFCLWPQLKNLIRPFVALFLNASCIGTTFVSGRSFGCLIAEILISLLTFVFGGLLNLFDAKLTGCKADAFPATPCYCSTAEGGFFSGMPPCPAPKYICIEKDGQFTEVAETTYNGIVTRETILTGPTRAATCRNSFNSPGTRRLIGRDCKEICHIEESGEGWWVNECDGDHAFIGHCSATPSNMSAEFTFNKLVDESRNMHMKEYLKKPWVDKKQKRQLFSSLSQATTLTTTGPRKSQMSISEFTTLLKSGLEHSKSVENPLIDCSHVDESDIWSITKIVYNQACMLVGLNDLYGPKGRSIEEGFNPGRAWTQYMEREGRHLSEEEVDETQESHKHTRFYLENFTLRFFREPTWENFKKLHVSYINNANLGWNSSIGQPSVIVDAFNATAQIAMAVHRRTENMSDTYVRRQLFNELSENAFEPGSSRQNASFMCPGTNEIVLNRISTDPNRPGLNSCRFPQKWSPWILLQYIGYAITTFYYTFSPFNLISQMVECWDGYATNPESDPLTPTGIVALINNDASVLDTKTFCFPLYRKITRIKSIVWSFLTFVEEQCAPEYNLSTGRLDRCLCPQFNTGPPLVDFTSQWIAFIPLAIKLRLINFYRTLQLIWTSFIPLYISDIWTSVWQVLVPSMPNEGLYVFNYEYALGYSKYWGTAISTEPGATAFCVFITLQSTLFIFVYFVIGLFYFSYYTEFINHFLKITVVPLKELVLWIISYMNLQRLEEENPTVNSWDSRVRENPILNLLTTTYHCLAHPRQAFSNCRCRCCRRKTTEDTINDLEKEGKLVIGDSSSLKSVMGEEADATKRKRKTETLYSSIMLAHVRHQQSMTPLMQEVQTQMTLGLPPDPAEHPRHTTTTRPRHHPPPS